MPTLSIRVQVKDEHNATSEEVFTINVKDNILDETYALISSPTWEAGSNFSYSIDVLNDIILVGARYETTNGPLQIRCSLCLQEGKQWKHYVTR